MPKKTESFKDAAIRIINADQFCKQRLRKCEQEFLEETGYSSSALPEFNQFLSDRYGFVIQNVYSNFQFSVINEEKFTLFYLKHV